jgi:hypothetical protein
VNDDILVFFAGVTWDDFGVGMDHVPGGDAYANRSVLAYHFYQPPQVHGLARAIHALRVSDACVQRGADFQVKAQMAAANRLGSGAMLTETCAPECNANFNGPHGIAEAADRFMQRFHPVTMAARTPLR